MEEDVNDADEEADNQLGDKQWYNDAVVWEEDGAVELQRDERDTNCDWEEMGKVYLMACM